MNIATERVHFLFMMLGWEITISSGTVRGAAHGYLAQSKRIRSDVARAASEGSEGHVDAKTEWFSGIELEVQKYNGGAC